MNRSRDCFDLLCPFLCPYNPVRLTIHPSQLSLSNKMSTSHLHNLSSPSPVNSCKLPRKNRPYFTFGEESCPITWCISVHSAQFPSCLWRSFAMQSKSISQSSQTFSNLEQCVSSADALVTLHLARNADFLGSKHWAFHSVLGECNHTSLQNHPVFSFSIFHSGLWWSPHHPSKLHLKFHSVSFHCYNFQIIVISFQRA